jgi:YfiH family protein
MDQVHGDHVEVIAAPRDAPVPGADALVTSLEHLALGVLVADCVPLVLFDFDPGVVAVAHVGRRGLVAGIVDRTVEAMAALGARRNGIVAQIGPAICGRCYEVPAELRAEVDALVPGTATTTRWGTPGVDIPAGVRRQLDGVLAIQDMATCTYESADHFSHRRDGITGRFAGLVARGGWLD